MNEARFYHAQSAIPDAEFAYCHTTISNCLSAELASHSVVCQERALRALRANHVFGTDEKRIRTKNTVMNKGNCGVGLIFIQDRRLCADRSWFARNRRSARTGRRPRKRDHQSSKYFPLAGWVGEPRLRAGARQPRFLSGRKGHPNRKLSYWQKPKSRIFAAQVPARPRY